MRFLGLTIRRTPHSTPREREIVSPGGAEEAEISLSAFNALETRVEHLEMDNAERQLAVLSALEKVLNQLRAREARRDARADESQADDAAPAAGDGARRRPLVSHYAGDRVPELGSMMHSRFKRS